MEKRNRRIADPGYKIYLAAVIAIIIVSAVLTRSLLLIVIEGAVFLLAIAVHLMMLKVNRRDMLRYIETVTYHVESATTDSFVNFPLPMAVLRFHSEEIIWCNENFYEAAGVKRALFEVKLTDLLPGFDISWVMEGKNTAPSDVIIQERRYGVYGNLVTPSDNETEMLATIYLVETTEVVNLRRLVLDTRPVTAIIVIDNYDEVTKNLSDSQKSAMLAITDEKVGEWVASSGGLCRKYDRDKYLFVFEERYLKEYTDTKFTILDAMKDVAASGMQVTVSIGIGKDCDSYRENYHYAQLALDMALSRGGDQAVIRNRFGFEFFGGRALEVELRTKVKSRVMANALQGLIRDSSRVFVMGHKSADLDSLGAAAGIVCMCRKMKKDAYIVLDENISNAKALQTRLKTAEEYTHVFISGEDAMISADANVLLVVVDVNRRDLVDNPPLLESCNRVVVIDHHRRVAEYIDDAALTYHEPYASSAGEIVTELLQYMVEPMEILRVEADALLAGITLDTKSFTMKTGVRTFEAASFLKRAGADTLEIKRMFQSDFNDYLEKTGIVRTSSIYRSIISFAVATAETSKISAAQAADEMLGLTGVQASFVVFRSGSDTCISGRSLGRINVQVILEKFGGGGHITMAGAQVKDKTPSELFVELRAEVDRYLDAEAEKA